MFKLYDFSDGFWKCSESVVLFVFQFVFIFQSYSVRGIDFASFYDFSSGL